jgi:ribosome biogenesis GTPase
VKGRVIKSTGKFCDVLTDDGSVISCAVKGKFRIQGLTTTNPLAVGDLVEYSVEVDGGGVIHTIAPRKNYIIRKSVNLSHQAHIVACNVDRAYLVVTLPLSRWAQALERRFHYET